MGIFRGKNRCLSGKFTENLLNYENFPRKSVDYGENLPKTG